MLIHCLLTCILAATSDAETPVNLPDPIGLGERLVIIEWLKQQKIDTRPGESIEELRNKYWLIIKKPEREQIANEERLQIIKLAEKEKDIREEELKKLARYQHDAENARKEAELIEDKKRKIAEELLYKENDPATIIKRDNESKAKEHTSSTDGVWPTFAIFESDNTPNDRYWPKIHFTYWPKERLEVDKKKVLSLAGRNQSIIDSIHVDNGNVVIFPELEGSYILALPELDMNTHEKTSLTNGKFGYLLDLPKDCKFPVLVRFINTSTTYYRQWRIVERSKYLELPSAPPNR